ncbi:General transcription factor IIE subunit 1 [Colletotrichum fructicola]|nr:General transcription factor IIE subunit 1 [Colletotrichum fructicola]
MENSDVFIRTLVRAFYDAEHVIIIDTLLRHEILSLTELQALVAAPEERSLSEQCARLQRSGLVRITESSEKRDRYVFVDRRQAIHTASSTLRKMQDQISQIDAVSPAAITYECPNCVRTWELIDVIDSVNSSGHFICKNCPREHVLVEEPHLQQQLPRFNEQCRPFFAALQHFESNNSGTLPAVNFEDLYSRYYASDTEYSKPKRMRNDEKLR